MPALQLFSSKLAKCTWQLVLSRPFDGYYFQTVLPPFDGTTLNPIEMAQVRIWIHGVWGTKSRIPYMQNKSRRTSLFKHMKSYAKEKDIYLDFVNGASDHVHCLISMACDQNIARIMKLLKGESSTFAVKQRLFTPDFDWADDYYAVSVSQSHVEAVRDYLKKQEEHHRKKTFEEECRVFIEKYGFIRMLGGDD